MVNVPHVPGDQTIHDRLRGGLEPGDAALRRASVHWLRHLHGLHAVNGMPGRTPVAFQIVRNNLGHASIATTSGYLSTERDQRVQAMEGFWGDALESRRWCPQTGNAHMALSHSTAYHAAYRALTYFA